MEEIPYKKTVPWSEYMFEKYIGAFLLGEQTI